MRQRLRRLLATLHVKKQLPSTTICSVQVLHVNVRQIESQAEGDLFTNRYVPIRCT